MTINRYALGERIYSSRKKMKMTQSDLAEKVGISNTYLSHIENGSGNMSMDIFVDIANALGVTADELLSDSILSDDNLTGDQIVELLNGCGGYEKSVILEVVAALRNALRSNGSYLPKW